MPTGVHFNTNNTTAVSRSIVSKAVRPVDSVRANEILHDPDWRSNFTGHLRFLVEAGLDSSETARSIAKAGLTAAHEEMFFGQRVLKDVTANLSGAFEFKTKEIRGKDTPMAGVAVPYRGQSLRGSTLMTQIDEWITLGVITPAVRDVVSEVLDNPDWLKLDGDSIVLLGAQAQTGPLRYLLAWGADVVAIDLPSPDSSRQLASMAEGGAGRVRFPIRPGAPKDERIFGADLIYEFPEVATWLEAIPERLTLGHYYYTESARYLLLSLAGDALNAYLMGKRPDVGLAYLFSPAGAYAVGAREIDLSAQRFAHSRTWWRKSVGLLSRGHLLTASYPQDYPFGICDAQIPQQGPYYALAKQIQRWRATNAIEAGHRVSARVAPLTFTQSLLANKAIAAACSGAQRFGIEVLEPETSQALMAIMLVHDLRAERPRFEEPWREEHFAASHNGLWTCAYSPRSVLSLAAVAGMRAGQKRPNLLE
jgi:hypothetical protein